MSKSLRRCVVGSIVLAASSVFANRAIAGGIEVPMQGAKAAGQADAFTAQADDPSAIFYNPAGLTQLKGTQISAGLYFLQPAYHFEGDDGRDERMELPTYLPHFYAVSDFGLDKWRFGIGINNPFGINEDFGDGGSFRSIVDDAQLMCINIAPTVAYQVNPNFSLGLAFNTYVGSALLTRHVPLGGGAEGEFHFRGEDVSFGVTPGVLWKIDERNTIGAYYRSPFSLNFDGDAKVDFAGTNVVGPSDTKANLHFPQSVGVGYAFRPTPDLKLEADVIWTDWHAVKNLMFDSSNPAFNGQKIPANWDSGFTYRLGVEYLLDKHWALRTGYAYGQNAVPNSTFNPLVPDSNYHLGAVGIGYSTERWSFDVAANLIYRETHHVEGSVNSPLVDGDWGNLMYGVMATLTFKL